jgi:pimeloyl-ACP methyl ester carboxylesterase
MFLAFAYRSSTIGTMKNLLAIVALVLVACGCGGSETACNGAPQSAVIYVGTEAFPELSTLPDACVYTSPGANAQQLAELVAVARTESHRPRVHLIGSGEGATTALRYMITRHGMVESASLWHAGTPTGMLPGTRHFQASTDVVLNGLDCERMAAPLGEWYPTVCRPTAGLEFGAAERATALTQLNLPQ